MAGEVAGSIIVDTELNSDGFKAGSEELQRAVRSLSGKVSSLGPALQKAMSGSVSALGSFGTSVETLEGQISDLEAKMADLGNAKVSTEEFSAISAEAEKAGRKLEQLLNRQEKMQATGVKEESAEWKSLSYDLQLVAQKYDQLIAAKARMEATGSAFQIGSETAEYQRMNAELAEAQQRLAAMRAEAEKGKRPFRNMMSSLTSSLKAAVSSMSKLIYSNNRYKQSFSGVLSSIKRIAPALLATEGVLGLLRKAVNAYMSANQQLAATLSSCWSGIGNLLGPIIERLVNLIATAVSYFTAFMNLLGFTGKAATKAISSAGGSAAKETKKLKRQLAAFDELTVLNHGDESGGGGGGGGAAAAELPEVELPDWVKLMVDQLKAGEWSNAAQTLTGQLNSMVAGVDWDGIGTKAGYGLNGALTFLATALLTFDWFALGSNLATSLNGVITGVDWKNLGTLLMSKWIIIIGTLGGFFRTLNWSELGKALADALWGLWEAVDFGQAARMFYDGVTGVLTTISSAIKNINWAQYGTELWNAWISVITGVDWAGLIGAALNLLGAAVGGASALIFSVAKNLWNAFVAACDSVFEYFRPYVEEMGGNLIAGLLYGILDALANIGSWIIDNIFDPFIEGFKSAFGIHSPSTVMQEQGGFVIEGLLLGITNAWSNITKFFATALSSLKATLSDAWDGIKSTASSMWGDIKSSITVMMTEAFSFVQNQDWFSVGSNICTGIGNGITAGWNWLKEKVQGLASSLLNAAKSALDIHSPSRLFRDEVGYMLGLGVAEGMEDSESTIVGTVQGVAEAISDEFAANSYSVAPIGVDGLGNITRSMDGFTDKICNSFTSLMDRLSTIASGATFAVPAVAAGTVVPYNSAGMVGGAGAGMQNGAISAVQEIVASVMADMLPAMVAGFESVVAEQRELQNTVKSIEIGDSTIGRAAARYNRRQNLIRGGSVE